MRPRPVTPVFPNTAIFADEFDRGRSYANWRPRGSGDWLLIATIAGSGAIGFPGGAPSLSTRPGDFLLYEPEAAQDYGTAPEAGRWRLRWAHFLPRAAWHGWLRRWPEIAPRTRLVHLPASSPWRKPGEEALGRTIQACRRAGPVQVELALAALEEAILCGLAILEGKEGDPRIDRAAALLTDRFKEPFRLPALARECGLSVSRFSHLFRERMGKTPGRFVEEQRLSHAAHLLRRTALHVGEIAAECGFADPFYFTNRFRRRHRTSPTAFREKARAAQG